MEIEIRKHPPEVIDVDPAIIRQMNARLADRTPPRRHYPIEYCAYRYSRLLTAMRWVAILSHTEAAACLRDYRDGLEWSGEAVNHFGGTRKVVERAIKTRAVLRKYRNGRYDFWAVP